MNKISATIITHNEELNIERCLKSLDWVDEIVVVDSGSNDKTLEICKKYNCIVVITEWQGFGKTKKFAVDNASNDWIFSIDADEEVTRELKERIIKILQAPKYNAYHIKRNSFYLGKEIKHCGWDNDFPLRLFNRNFGNFNAKEVHESIVVNCDKERISEPLMHYTYPTISSHIQKINRYTDLSLLSIDKKYSLTASMFFGINKFIKMYFLKKGFLDGKVGLILCLNSAYGVYLKYLKTCQNK